MLTKKQHELLLFINQKLAATGVSPSFDEMKDALKLRWPWYRLLRQSGIRRVPPALG